MYQFGPFLLDPAERILSCGGSPLSLTPKAFDTLLCLVRNRGRMLTKDELLRQVWPDTFVEEINLAVNISTLRKAIGDNARDGLYIVTVPGRGYRFVGEVHEVASELERAAIPAPDLPDGGVAVGRGHETSADPPGPSVPIAEAPAPAAKIRSLKLAIPAAVAFLTVAIPGG